MQVIPEEYGNVLVCDFVVTRIFLSGKVGSYSMLQSNREVFNAVLFNTVPGQNALPPILFKDLSYCAKT